MGHVQMSVAQERDTDTGDGMQGWGHHVRWCNAGAMGTSLSSSAPDTMMIGAIRHLQTFNDWATGPGQRRAGFMRIVMSGVSSIQFMDALKEISCKLGCRSHI